MFGVAIDDLQERAARLLDLRWLILTYPQVAQDYVVPIAELRRELLTGHVWEAIIPPFRKFVRTVVTVCDGLAEEIIEGLIRIIRARGFVAFVNARFVRAVTTVAGALTDPEA